MSEAAQKSMTVDEFLATAEEREGRWEIEDGVAYAMAPERLDHARVKGETFIALRTAIRRAGLPCEAVTDSVAVRITARTAYQPDALVYCGERLPPEAREVPAPVIVVEVLSPSTEWRDAHRKLIGYFSRPSVAHYLTIDPRDRSVAHHKRAEGGLIETRILYDGLLKLDPPGLELTVADLFPAE
jgi:Uma2 family endonuclease